MPITIEEMFGRESSSDRGTRVFMVLGTNDESTARAQALAAAPATVDGKARHDAEPEEIPGVSGGGFLVRVQYRSDTQAQPAEGDSTFAFETTGGQQHIVVSRETVGAYGNGATTTENGGIIGTDGKTVQGTDIVVPIYTWSETHWMDPATVDLAYRGTLFDLTGTVNNASFKGTAAGETLFMGASGTRRGDDPWEIAFRFASAPNITGIAKKGWEYLWVAYEPAVAGTLKRLTQKPVAVYVEQVYDEENFSLLGIGT